MRVLGPETRSKSLPGSARILGLGIQRNGGRVVALSHNVAGFTLDELPAASAWGCIPTVDAGNESNPRSENSATLEDRSGVNGGCSRRKCGERLCAERVGDRDRRKEDVDVSHRLRGSGWILRREVPMTTPVSRVECATTHVSVLSLLSIPIPHICPTTPR